MISHKGSMVKLERNEGEQDINRIRVAKFYDWKGVFEEEVDEKEGEKKSILKEKEKVGMQTRSKKVKIDEVYFGSNEENKVFKMKRKEEEAEVVRLGDEEEEVGSV